MTVTVTFDEAEVDEMLVDKLRLVYWDEAQTAWMPVTTTVDITNRQVTAQISHFSQWGIEGEDDVFFNPYIESGQVSLFSGDSSFSYGLDVPVGPGGLQVPLTLRYSAGTPNGMIGDDNTDTGWVGVGWTLELGKIEGILEEAMITWNSLSDWAIKERGLVTTTSTQEYDWDNAEGGGDPYIGTRLRSRYKTIPNESFLRIESDLFEGTATTSGWEVTNKGWWDIWGQDGTRYVFGKNAYDESEKTGSSLSKVHWVGEERHYRVWKLDTITDTHGNELRIDYDVYPMTRDPHKRPNLKESYPASIKYTTNYSATTQDSHAEYEVEFEVITKTFDIQKEKRIADTGYMLEAVNVWYEPSSGASQELVRRYEFTYTVSFDDHIRLKNIIHFGADWYQGCTACEPLSTITFTYYYDGDHKIGWKTLGGPTHGWSYQAQRPFLHTVENDYGGDLTFEYEDYCLPTWHTCSSDVGWGKRQLAITKTLSAGIGPEMTSAYAYADPGCTTNTEGNPPVSALDQFIGFGQATETMAAADRQTLTYFDNTTDGGDQDDGDPEDPYKGKTLKTEVKDLSGTLYARTTTTYVDGREQDWNESVHFVYASEVKEETCEGASSCQSKKTTYQYDPVYQNYCGTGEQYGNVTRVSEYASATAQEPYRTTLTGYCPNTDDWIVNKPAFTNIYAGEAPTGTLVASTWYNYDDSDDAGWDHPPLARGELLGTRVYSETNKLIDKRYWYDDYGNVIQTKAYDAYGTDEDWSTGSARTTTTEYDSVHHTFPLTTTNPLGYKTVTEYYGVDGVGLTNGLPGQVKSTTDMQNGDTTYLRYDDFGRPTRTLLPGNTEWLTPNLQYAYYTSDNMNWGSGPRSMVVVQQRVAEDVSNLWTRKLYDGLGRLVQAQSPAEDWVDQGGGTTGGHDVVQSREYDAAGQVSRSYLPIEVNSYDYDSQSPQSPYTTTVEYSTTYSYDTLGRSLVITNPDGTTIEYHYGMDNGLAYEDVMDANRHRKMFLSDALGRMVEVREYEGNCWNGDPPWDYPCEVPYTVTWRGYATTTYAYDNLDNLTTVTDTLGNVTEMTYNFLGQKTGMDDPDMGEWGYTYDALGNLATQTDAKGQIITFSYDDLSRLTQKDYSTDAGSVYYKYDDYKGSSDAGATNSWGRLRASYVGSESANGHTYAYDDRGQLVSDTVKIDNEVYRTHYDYDEAGRVVTMTYPSGEEVVSAYNMMGSPESLIGDTTYVHDAAYNALGQMTELDFGADSGAKTLFDYYSASAGNNRLQQIEVYTTSSPVALDLAYTYDDVGNVKTITDGTLGDQIQTFTYDHLDRLTQAIASGGTISTYSRSYVYNEIGNMTSKATISYTYPASGEDSVRPHAVISTTSGDSFTYDANGNMEIRTEEGISYLQSWDAENRLEQVTAPGEATFSDEFNTKDTTAWTYNSYQTVPFSLGGQNVVKNVGTDSGYNANYYRSSYSQGSQGSVQFEFQVTGSNSSAHFALETSGSWGQAGHNRWCLLADSGKLEVQYRIGTAATQYPKALIDPVTTNAWYVATLVVDDERGAYMHVYKKDDPGVQGSYHLEGMPEGGSWRFHHWLYRDVAYLDHYTEHPADETHFTYNADGALVKKETPEDTTTHYAGGLYEVMTGTLTLSDPGFESSGTWTETVETDFPATSFYYSITGTAEAHAGSYAYALGNHASGYLESDYISVIPRSYDLYAYVRGELDADDSHGTWEIRAAFYENVGQQVEYYELIEEVTVDSGGAGTLSTTWQQKGGQINVPRNADVLRIRLVNTQNSGWAAFDDVSLKLGAGANLVTNPGFESGTSGWTEVGDTDFPATSFYHDDEGTAAGRSGGSAYAISNHVYGYLRSRCR